MKRRQFPIVLLLLLSCLLAEGRLRLVRADKLENFTKNETSMQVLNGDVVFRKDNIFISSRRAEYHESTDQGWMIDSVTVRKEDMYLVCDSLHFHSPSNTLKAFIDVQIFDEDYELLADSLIYYPDIDSGKAMGHTKLTQIDQVITADTITYVKSANEDAVSYTASGNVIIQEEDRTATCGLAQYERTHEQTILTLQPKVVESDRTLSGSEIFLQYQDEELRYLEIPSDAKAVSTVSGWRDYSKKYNFENELKKSLSFENELTGKTLRGFFQNGTMDSMRIEGMATTRYHVFEDSIYQGFNNTSGDTISLQFFDDALQYIVVIGGCEGTYTPDSVSQEMDSPVSYESNMIRYQVPDEMTTLHQNAKLHYEDVDLHAGFVDVDWNTNLLHALPLSPGDTTTKAIRPTLLQSGQEPMEGDHMTYNLHTQHGKVIQGNTKVDDGFYYGDEIRNKDKSTIFVQNSIYTTCDHKLPHFHFDSDKMKLIQNDKVIAKPIILYIGGIPIMGLPFGIFPDQGGKRHSGWIMPSYGESRIRGQFLDGLGYYWAPNPYWDTRFILNFADRQGITFKAISKYKKRYKYSGNLHLETRQFLLGGEKDITGLKESRRSDYVLKWNHNQTLRRNQTFKVNASYYSNGDYNHSTGIQQNTRLNQQAISNATYRKSWKKSNNSISMNLSVTQDLMSESRLDSNSVFYQAPTSASSKITYITGNLPNVTFRHGKRSLFPTQSSDTKWYHSITWGYSNTFSQKLRSWFQAEEIVHEDSTVTYEWELDNDGEGIIHSEYNRTLNHSISFNANQKIFRYISLVPSLSINSKWIGSYMEAAVDDTGGVYLFEKEGFAAKTTGAFKLSSSTNIYGFIPVSIGPLQAVRHVITPSIGYSYTPDFSKPILGFDPGYYRTFQDTTWDRFRGTDAGSTPNQERQSMTFSIRNVFKAKVLTDNETEKKIDLLSWNMSSSYNFAAEEFQMANLSSSLRTKIANLLNLDISMTHDFYDFQDGQRVSVYHRLENGMIFPRLTKLGFSTSFSFKGKRFTETLKHAVEDTVDLDDEGPLPGNYTPPAQSGKFWSTRLSIRYSLNAFDPSNPQKTFWMNSSSSIQLTKNWGVRYNARFDMIERDLVSHSFSLYRDLHCWELSLNWTPNGYGQGVYLKINVKSPTLSDLKLEQRGGIFQSRSY